MNKICEFVFEEVPLFKCQLSWIAQVGLNAFTQAGNRLAFCFSVYGCSEGCVGVCGCLEGRVRGVAVWKGCVRAMGVGVWKSECIFARVYRGMWRKPARLCRYTHSHLAESIP